MRQGKRVVEEDVLLRSFGKFLDDGVRRISDAERRREWLERECARATLVFFLEQIERSKRVKKGVL